MKKVIDVQKMQDDRNITIDKVGVKNVRYPIVVDDKMNGTQNTIAELDIYVELFHHHRGTHMSRFIEVLNRYHKENLIQKLPLFLQDIKKALHADVAYCIIRFPYFIQKDAPISKISSLMSYNCFFEAVLKQDYKLYLGVEVPVTALCPCSKEVSDYGAHNQRSLVSVKVLSAAFIWLEEIIEIVENSASCDIYSLLKRVDEKYVTEKAYDNPAFVEDIVRAVTVKLQEDERISSFVVESDNQESIHNHSAYACVISEEKENK